MEVFDHPYLCNIARIGWDDPVSNVQVGNLVLCACFENSLVDFAGASRVLYYEHSSTVPCPILLPPRESKNPCGVQQMA